MSEPVRCERHANVLTECHWCCKVLGLAEYRPAPAPTTLALACVHEGPIVEPCKGCKSELRHVRACLHPAPSADRDTCTRGFVSGLVQSCDRCPDWEIPT